MIELDPRTVIFINFLYTFCITIFISIGFVFWKRRFKGFLNWIIAFLLLSLNFLIISLRGTIPVPIVIVLPHIFSVWAYIEIKRGLARFYDMKNRIYTDFIIIIILTAFLILNDTNARLRVISVCIASIAVYIDIIIMFISKENDKDAKNKIIPLLFGIAIIVMSARLTIGLKWHPGVNPLDTGNNLSIISLLFFITNIVIFFSILFIVIRKFLDERNILIEKIRAISLTDELTGLMNRRGFNTVTNYEINRFVRTNKGFTLAIGDIDLFKSVNDNYGHECGDRIIKSIGDIIKNSSRSCDTVARWGGEEFVVLFPETDAEEAEIILERIRVKIEETKFQNIKNHFNKTISFGACFCSVPNTEVKNVINIADKNLYTAKETGRNKIVVSSF